MSIRSVDGNSTHAHRHTGITLHTYLGSFAGIKVAVAVAVPKPTMRASETNAFFSEIGKHS